MSRDWPCFLPTAVSMGGGFGGFQILAIEIIPVPKEKGGWVGERSVWYPAPFLGSLTALSPCPTPGLTSSRTAVDDSRLTYFA